MRSAGACLPMLARMAMEDDSEVQAEIRHALEALAGAGPGADQ